MRAQQGDNGPLPDFLDSVPHGWSEATHQGRIFIFDAFISHATGDVERSRTLSDKLGARGLRIWHDDEQRMDDARWALRLGSALRNSRFVIVVAAPDSDLMRRPWVPIECKSAVDCEASLPGISRLMVGRTTPDAPVPAEFADCRQFDLEAQLDELVALVQAGNRLPPLGRAPSTMSLAEARTLVRSLCPPAPPKQNPSGELKPPKQRVLHTLMTSVSRALAETEADPTAPSYGLYEVWDVSQLTPDEPVCNDDVQWLIPVLEALTAVGHTESRANACFGLRGLTTWGASAAAAALRRVVVREENEDIVQLVAEWFGRTAGLDWNSLAAEDCARVLLLLPLTNVEMREELFTRLPLALRVVALPGIVARVTQRAFDQLNIARVHQAQARFKELCRNGRAMDWEVYFRELEAFLGVERDLVHYDHVPLPDRVDTYLLLVSEFARVELERGSNMTWRMMYEPAILKPLAKLSVHDLYRDRAMTTYNAVLDAMEAPVRQDLEARRREPVRTRREMEQAARLFLIEAFRRGPYFKQMEHGIYVQLTSVQDTAELMSRAEEIWKDGRQDGTDTVHDAWAGVDLV
jgi:TIR domain